MTKVEKMHTCIGIRQHVRTGNRERRENPGWTITREKMQAGKDAEPQNQLCCREVGLGDDKRKVKQWE